MDLSDIVKRVKDRSHRGDVTVTTDLITEQIVRAVNDSRRDIVLLIPQEWLKKDASTAISTVSGTSTYTLASDVQEPILFRYTTGGADYFLKKLPSEREFYQQLYSSNTSNNKPLYYTDAGYDSTPARKIILFPTPDAVYTINYVYYKDPTGTELTTSDLNTEIPDIPDYLQNALWQGALYYFLKNFDDPAQTIAESDFEKAKLAAKISEESDLDDESRFRWDKRPSSFYDPDSGFRLI